LRKKKCKHQVIFDLLVSISHQIARELDFPLRQTNDEWFSNDLACLKGNTKMIAKQKQTNYKES
jgi:hypothetical protein